MGLFGLNKAKVAEARLVDEALYAIALREIESGHRRDGLWARSLSECSMNQKEAAARYIQFRVQALKDEHTLLAEEGAKEKLRESRRQIEHEQTRIAAAEADLPRHPKCGGIIDRIEAGASIRWKCRKCRSTGEFSITQL